jgi:hypothetical protein
MVIFWRNAVQDDVQSARSLQALFQPGVHNAEPEPEFVPPLALASWMGRA